MAQKKTIHAPTKSKLKISTTKKPTTTTNVVKKATMLKIAAPKSPQRQTTIKRKQFSDKQIMAKVPWYKQNVSLGRVKTLDIAMMSKHLSVMLAAGLSVPEALEVITEQSNGGLARVMRRVYRRVEGGISFGKAVGAEQRTFSSTFVSAILVGENSGTLAENLKRLAIQMERDLNLRRNVQSAMLYPGIVLTIAIVLGFGVAIFVLPDLADIFDSLNVDLPLTTRILIALAHFFENYGLIVAPITFIGIAVLIWFARQKATRPFFDHFYLSLPIVSEFTHMLNRARFTRTAGTLLQSGTPIQEALEITANIMPNYVYEKSVERMRREVGGGSDFSDIIAQYPDLYPKMIQRMIAVGDRSASLGSTLEYLADFYEERMLVLSKNLSSILEPILLVTIGGIVGLLAISILTPLYSILSAVNT